MVEAALCAHVIVGRIVTGDMTPALAFDAVNGFAFVFPWEEFLCIDEETVSGDGVGRVGDIEREDGMGEGLVLRPSPDGFDPSC